MKTIKLFFAVLLAIVFTACSQSNKNTVEYVPFQETENGQWGMISMDGKVLFSEEFKNEPTVVRDGRFFVRTNKGFWEMYEASPKPRKIGAEYAHVCGFRNGVALVSEKNKPVSIIDTEGKTVKLLDKIEGKEVDAVNQFQEGYAIFMTTDSLYGVINQKGDCIVKPEYYYILGGNDGKFIVIHKKYKKFIDKKKDDITYSVLDTEGNVISEFKSSKYHYINTFSEGLMGISVIKEGKEIFGFINERGEEIVTPQPKYQKITFTKGGKFIYFNGEAWGLTNLKGETLIRAKYDDLYLDDNILLAGTKKDKENYEYKLIDTNDNQIGEDKYVGVLPFSLFDNEHTIVKINDKTYSFVDKNGKQLKNLPGIYNIGIQDGEEYVRRDCIDYNKFIKDCKITKESVFGISFKMTPKEAVDLYLKEHKGDEELSYYRYGGNILSWFANNDPYYQRTTDNIDISVSPKFSNSLVKQTYREEVYGWGYWFGWGYYPKSRKVPNGYEYNDASLQSFDITLSIYQSGIAHNKVRDIFKAFINKFKTFGKEIKKNENATVISIDNKKSALIYISSGCVECCGAEMYITIKYGNIGNPQNIDIDEYKEVSEPQENYTNVSGELLSSGFLGLCNIGNLKK